MPIKDWIPALLRWNEEMRQGRTSSPPMTSLQLVLSVDAVPVKRNELDSIRRLSDEPDVTNTLISLDA